MKFLKLLSAFLILGIGISLFSNHPAQAQWNFIRGDANGNGQIDPDDFSTIFDIIVRDSIPGCADAADVNDDGQVTPVDLDYLGNYIFYDSAPPPPPFPNCGSDPTPDTLTCTFTQCSMSTFIRGDVNCDGVVDTMDLRLVNTDVVFSCLDRADVDDNGFFFGPADSSYLADYLFFGGPPPPHPFPTCGPDTTADGIDCEYGCCCTLTTQCNDGIDNDGDGFTDLADCGCTDACDTLEGSNMAQCNDGIDNDGDGMIDLADPQCADSCDKSELCSPDRSFGYLVNCCYMPGDVRGDHKLNLTDLIGLVNIVFKGAPKPDPLCRADANGDRNPSISDIVYLVNYVFKGGQYPVMYSPCCIDRWH